MSQHGVVEPTFLFEKVAFIGLGLIGSSMCRVMRERVWQGRLLPVRVQNQTIKDAIELRLIDEGFSDPAKAVQDADLVILALPVRATQKVLQDIALVLKPNAIITDVGSTKGNVVDAAKAVFGEQLPSGFVPGHPIAGSEHTGVHAGRADLFAHHKVILTPLPTSSDVAVKKLTQLWQATQAEVICMSVAEHDEVLAQTSHLPHLLAFNLIEQLASSRNNLDIFRYAAGWIAAILAVLLPVIRKCGTIYLQPTSLHY